MANCDNIDCQQPITDHAAAHCPKCGEFIGFPNHRKAMDECADLMRRYQGAVSDLDARGLTALRHSLEALAESCKPVVTMSIAICRDLLKDKKYKSYFIGVEHGDRNRANEDNLSVNMMIRGRLYPGYEKALHYGCMSPDGTGLPNYGEVSVQWRVTNAYLGRRASLLERNEYAFFDEHGLGDRYATVPSGYRAVWDDRAKLTVAKLAPDLSRSTAIRDLPNMILAARPNRNDDIFVEIVIFGETGISGDEVEGVRLESVPTNDDDRRDWDSIIERCTARGIAIS
jgi:hypothetical protein